MTTLVIVIVSLANRVSSCDAWVTSATMRGFKRHKPWRSCHATGIWACNHRQHRLKPIGTGYCGLSRNWEIGRFGTQARGTCMISERHPATRAAKLNAAAKGRTRPALYAAALLLPGSAIILPVLWWLDPDASAGLRAA